MVPQQTGALHRRNNQFTTRIYGSSTSSSKAAPFLCNYSLNLYLCSYFFLPIVFPDTLAYILVLMLTSIDFWVVKNIVGRKLVKLRWWYMIDSEGNERWHYESRGKQEESYHAEANILFQDKMVFWGTLMVTPCVWLLFAVMNAITFAIFKTATTVICACIGAVQYWGFKNCQKAHERKKILINKRKAKQIFQGK